MPTTLDMGMSKHNMMESTATTAEQKGSRLQQVRTCSNATAVGTEIKERSCLPLKGLRYAGIFSKIPLPPLPALKRGLGRGGSWLQLFWSLRNIACTWAPLGWPCLLTHQVLNHCFKPWLSISTTASHSHSALGCSLVHIAAQNSQLFLAKDVGTFIAPSTNRAATW